MASAVSPSASGHVLPDSTTSHAQNSIFRSRRIRAALCAIKMRSTAGVADQVGK